MATPTTEPQSYAAAPQAESHLQKEALYRQVLGASNPEELPEVMRSGLVQNLRIDRANLERQQAQILERYLDQHLSALESAKQQVDAAKAVLDNLMSRSKETDVASELKSTNIRSVDPAAVPEDPIRPKKLHDILLGVIPEQSTANEPSGLLVSAGLDADMRRPQTRVVIRARRSPGIIDSPPVGAVAECLFRYYASPRPKGTPGEGRRAPAGAKVAKISEKRARA